MTIYSKWVRLLRKEGEAISLAARSIGAVDSITGIPAIAYAASITIRGYISPPLTRRNETEAGPIFTTTSDFYTQYAIGFGDRFTYDGDTWEVHGHVISVRRKSKTVVYKAPVVKVEAS
jgi:hypothetical protein